MNMKKRAAPQGSRGQDPDRFSLIYLVNGKRLDVDRLLTKAPPVAKYESWRKGTANPVGGKAKTSGLRIFLYDGSSQRVLETRIRSFLETDARFLRAVARHPEVEASMLHLGLFVHGPVSVSISAALLHAMAKSGVAWRVTGYPCSD
jgi:hypothetical protein